MPSPPTFKEAYPYQKDVLALPVTDLDTTSTWYAKHFGMTEVERRNDPEPTVILERDSVRIGFSINGGDASQDGAAILVNNIKGIKGDLDSRGTQTGEFRIDENDGGNVKVFFVAAPDGLCYYFHEPVDD